MQQAPGRWQWMPAQPAKSASRPLQWYEYLLGYGALAVYVAINLILLVQQIAAGWRW